MLSSSPKLDACLNCRRIYAKDKQDELYCDSGSLQVDFRGKLFTKHTPNPEFNVNEYVVAMYIKCQSWKKVFWRLWGAYHHFKCTECQETFSCIDLLTCQRHESPPHFPTEDSLKGFYKCCTTTAHKFDPFIGKHGCRYFNHVPQEPSLYLDIFKTYIHEILWTERTLDTLDSIPFPYYEENHQRPQLFSEPLPSTRGKYQAKKTHVQRDDGTLNSCR